MLVVQICNAESGVSSPCYFTGIKIDCCVNHLPNTYNFPTNWRATHHGNQGADFRDMS